MLEITDPDVLATSGERFHPIVSVTGNSDDFVPGTVFQVTAVELAEADRYEVADYDRQEVTLASGKRAWVYVKASKLTPTASTSAQSNVAQFTIRPAKAGDAESISTLLHQTFALACPPGTPLEDIDAYATAALQPSHIAVMVECTDYRCWVVEAASKVHGVAMLDLHPEPIGVEAADAAQAAELKRCYVYPVLHGTGAASALVKQAIGCYHGALRLTVANQNLRAQAFYKKHGFFVVGETQFLCGNDVHRDLVMLRLLPKQ